MQVAATLLYDTTDLRRGRDRQRIDRATTLRENPQQPIDVILRDVSQYGCFIETTLEMAIDAPVRLGIPGSGAVEAVIKRRAATGYGCEFTVPLDWENFERGLTSETVLPLDQAAEHASPQTELQAAPEPHIVKWRGGVRAAIAVGSSVLIWGAILMAAKNIL